MPVVIEIPALFAGIAALFTAQVVVAILWGIVIVLVGFLTAMAESLPWPFSMIFGGIANIVQKAADLLQSAFNGLDSLIGAWFDGVGIAIDAALGALESLGGATYDAISGLRNVVIPAVIGAVTSPILDAVDWLNAQGRAFEELLARGIDDLGTELGELRDVMATGIDRLTVDIAELRHEVWARGIDRIDHILDDIIPSIRERVDSIADRLADIPHDIGDLLGKLRDVLPWVTTLAAGIAATEALTAIRSASQFRHKADRLCLLDLDEVDDLLGLALPILSLAAITQIAELARDVAIEVGPLMREMTD